ncbi:MAG: hypothetical protein WAV41_02910 [Microgenomates group bacterium]
MAGADVLKVTQYRLNGPSTSFRAWHTQKDGGKIPANALETREVKDGQILFTRSHSEEGKVIVGRADLRDSAANGYRFHSAVDNLWIQNTIENVR